MKSYGFKLRSKAIIFLWPLICLVSGIILWIFVDAKLTSERAALETRAIRDVASLSRVYAAYLTRSLEQMDQTTMHIKSDWERLNRNLKLEDLRKGGLFTASEFVSVTIINREGYTVTSTLPIDPERNVSRNDYFLYHQSNISSAMRISKPELSNPNKQPILYFSRRLDTADDEFDGIVLVAVTPSYFVSFYDDATLGKQGLLAVIGEDQTLRAFTIGGKQVHSREYELEQPASLSTLQQPRLVNDFAIFSDHSARYIGRQELKSYPLAVVIGLSEGELLTPYEKAWETYRILAYIGTAFLIVVAIVGAIFTQRIIEKESQAYAIRRTYRMVTESANEGFYILHPVRNAKGDTIDWHLADSNESGAAFYALPREKFIGMRLSSLYPNPMFQHLLELFHVVSACGIYEDEYRVPADSPINCAWLYRRVVRSEDSLAITLRDISEAKKSEQELLRLANEDALTGLPNRHWLIRFLPVAIQRAQLNGKMLAVLFIDLDEFKNINDTLGHSVGDQLLKITAQRIKSVLRPSDRIVRLGGDEFTVIVEQLENNRAAEHVAERITQALHAPVELGGNRHTIHASIGISVFPKDGMDAEMLLKNADIAMYSVKTAGKGNYHFFEPQLYENLKDRLNREKALQYAIAHGHFMLHYQPRVDTMSGELCGMEALVRWNDPQHGIIPPLKFISLAEETGLILPLGELVIEKACAQIAEWKAMQLPVVPVSVNVSARQFNDGDVKTSLLSAIARHNIDPADIQVELTESAMMGEQANTISQLADMRSQGIKLLVDDFGTGYSSLSQLQRLDLDVLKVDRAFTSELSNSVEGQIFFKAIVSMAHALGMKVTAEGVENIQQLAILRSLGCDEVQGYFISHPLPAEKIEHMMQNQYKMLTPRLA